MLLYVYLGLVLFLLVFVIKNMVREKNLMLQIDAALVVVPLVLRRPLPKWAAGRGRARSRQVVGVRRAPSAS